MYGVTQYVALFRLLVVQVLYIIYLSSEWRIKVDVVQYYSTCERASERREIIRRKGPTEGGIKRRNAAADAPHRSRDDIILPASAPKETS